MPYRVSPDIVGIFFTQQNVFYAKSERACGTGCAMWLAIWLCSAVKTLAYECRWLNLTY